MLPDENDPRTYTLSGTDRDKHLSVTVAGVQVSAVRFNVDGDEDTQRLELVQVDTPAEHQRKRHASHALWYLATTFPDLALINSPSYWNTTKGDGLVTHLRAQGIRIHDYGCYRSGHQCRCGLSE